jgi:hypothetical protein
VLQVWERRRGLQDDAYVVDGITGSGRGRCRCIKGFDRGRERWHRGSEEDSMTAQALGRSMTARALGKFLTGNFGNLTQ